LPYDPSLKEAGTPEKDPLQKKTQVAQSIESVSARAFVWKSAAVTSTGNVRSHNEDSILELPAAGVWVVADGMGGHNAGDVASRMIVDSLATMTGAERPSAFVDEVETRLRDVNSRLYQHSLNNDTGVSGSTVVTLLAFDRFALSVWAGDSRVYRSRGGICEQVTRDHSEVQELVETGVISADSAEEHSASNVITRAVGGTENLYLDLELRELKHNDKFLLCSDGLYKEVPEADIGRHLAANDPEGACKALLKHALSGKGSDNVSIIVVQFLETRR
jgi:type VI secretion system protein ImpM